MKGSSRRSLQRNHSGPEAAGHSQFADNQLVRHQLRSSVRTQLPSHKQTRIVRASRHFAESVNPQIANSCLIEHRLDENCRGSRRRGRHDDFGEREAAGEG